MAPVPLALDFTGAPESALWDFDTQIQRW